MHIAHKHKVKLLRNNSISINRDARNYLPLCSNHLLICLSVNDNLVKIGKESKRKDSIN